MAFLNCTFFLDLLRTLHDLRLLHSTYAIYSSPIEYNLCKFLQHYSTVVCKMPYIVLQDDEFQSEQINGKQRMPFLKTFVLEYLMLTILKVVSIQMCYQCLYVTLYKGVSFCLTPYHAPEILNWQKKGWWWQNFQEICCSKVIKNPFFPLMLLQFLYLSSYNYNVWQSITQNLAPGVKSIQYRIKIGL